MVCCADMDKKYIFPPSNDILYIHKFNANVIFYFLPVQLAMFRLGLINKDPIRHSNN